MSKLIKPNLHSLNFGDIKKNYKAIKENSKTIIDNIGDRVKQDFKDYKSNVKINNQPVKNIIDNNQKKFKEIFEYVGKNVSIFDKGDSIINSSSGTELKYSDAYNVSDNPLTRQKGVVYYNGHKETYYSQKVLDGKGLTALNNNGRHVASDGTIRDKDGYIAVACNGLPMGATVMTSLGPGKVYDRGDMKDPSHIDIYVNW